MAVSVEMAVEMAGIEPATATLAGRARYLSCHPRPEGFGIICLGLPFMVLTLWTCQLSSLYERLSGTRASRDESLPGREPSGTVNSAGIK
jgi:hypothetical protein